MNRIANHDTIVTTSTAMPTSAAMTAAGMIQRNRRPTVRRFTGPSAVGTFTCAGVLPWSSKNPGYSSNSRPA
ncbi:MAG: hypothetical protein R2713_02815 [Ilumatobacteraceae bacterium]